MKINRLRTQEGVVTGHEGNTSNVLQDCEFLRSTCEMCLKLTLIS